MIIMDTSHTRKEEYAHDICHARITRNFTSLMSAPLLTMLHKDRMKREVESIFSDMERITHVGHLSPSRSCCAAHQSLQQSSDPQLHVSPVRASCSASRPSRSRK